MSRKRRLNPHRFDVSPRGVPEWTKRGWRGRSDLEPGQTLTRAETHIEKLEGLFHAAREKLGAVHTRAIRAESRVADLEADCAVLQHAVDVDAKAIQDAVRLEGRLAELSSEIAQLREARDRLAKNDGLVTMEVELKGGSRVVGHGVVVLPDQSEKGESRG